MAGAAWPVPISPSQANFDYNRQVDAQHFAQDMADTKYQRAVSSMGAAGLNPILAATSGFGAAMATSGSGSTVSGAGMSVDPTSAQQGELLDKQIEKATHDAGKAKWEKESALVDWYMKDRQYVNAERTSSSYIDATNANNAFSASRARTQREIEESGYGSGLRYVNRFPSFSVGNSGFSFRPQGE